MDHDERIRMLTKTEISRFATVYRYTINYTYLTYYFWLYSTTRLLVKNKFKIKSDIYYLLILNYKI